MSALLYAAGLEPRMYREPLDPIDLAHCINRSLAPLMLAAPLLLIAALAALVVTLI
ncbi:MAG: hypothetical protein KC503_09485 [Myxococcales bacterium]|nr:hypothetical protein [Myxococcales bacterium]